MRWFMRWLIDEVVHVDWWIGGLVDHEVVD